MKVIVTGGASGLGEAITRQLCADGHEVLFTYCNSGVKARTLTDENVNAHAVRCDFSNDQDIAELSEKILSFDPDGIVHNAISGKIPAIHFHKSDISVFSEGFKTNVLPVIRITQAALECFRKKKSGRIVTVLSSYVVGQPPIGLSAYVAEKNYLLSLTKSWAAEYARFGITANCVSPTFMRTPQNAEVDERVIETMIANHPLKRLLTPEEVAVSVARLLGSGPEINGTNQVINAGENAV